mmetsp:Transcript_22580/g.62840  ORF Transcript_22580/g.62840 Transcript_22580/m.62840 type:complete len:292 (+) Transcript_22580:190-1065(+)|eukprot:CAMPEP_0172380402 /NCGR_PEP_ID=MMETSP1060-20121228/70416_1 /TAXON_ID=37318 /ORGANISM="Pseudo-nitzschia pungens, Strain cf. cingulata" /LENGTH=291 /DNA_ID=CAMNT_0013108155 /DNA_START=96 /DNA_END=971 /DNA_ORIENTATION=+
MLSILSFSLVGALSFLAPNGWYLGTTEAYNVVRVCQNKHCCKRANTDVLQTIHNLVGTGGDGSVVVEASGCLSHCDKGPNMEVQTRDGTTVLQGMTDAQTCALQFGEVSSSSPLFPPVPKILIAASKVMEQSQRFGAMGQHEEQIRYLASVIAKLENSPAISPSTPANAHAHVLRAQAYLQLAEKQATAGTGAGSGSGDTESRSESIAASIRDARRVVGDFSAVATPASLSLAYRTWADALLEQQRDEERETRDAKDFSKVVAVLTQWYGAQPTYRTKLQGEIQGLLMGTS